VVSDAREEAAELFASGVNCAQAVLGAFSESTGLPPETAFRVAAGFGGGVGRTGGLCGAISGAVMALGLLEPVSDPRDPAAKARIYERVQTFLEEFGRVHGNLACRDLLGCDISTPEGFLEARRQGLLDSRCPEFVRTAAELVEEMT
jgi:C_GCAxxG_C_C family probable redox protein